MEMRSPREWFWNRLSRGEPPVVDDDEIIEVGFVDVLSGPMVMARLREAGLRVSSSDTRVNPYVVAALTRIVCRAGDRQRVQQIIDDVTSS